MPGSPLHDKLLPTLDFLLNDWLATDRLLERERFAEHDSETVGAFLSAAAQIAADKFEPANRTIDEQEPSFDGERVVLPKETAEAWRAFVDFGALQAHHDHEWGGMQLPRSAEFASKVIFAASSVAISPAILTEANASLLLHHGSPVQREVFARRELEGIWTGTMCLSESQAGSSLSDITTRAVPDGPDSADDPLGARYRITGSKMWISAGDHELADNIVHLVLAKIPGADGTLDPSTKGISLFVVPKTMVDEHGRLGERNDVALVSLNHKLGYRGLPNTALAFGDGSWEPRGARGAVGYLVGRAGEGLRQMFHMMNAARIDIGLSAAALGFAGYAHSLDYARERRQGRPTTATGKDPRRGPVRLIEHADVKRMLLAQKCFAEGGIALGLYAARLLDEQTTGDPTAAREAAQLLDLLTPVVKSWPSEWCVEANSLAIQVLGGAGYTRDHPVEQYWRDNRLNMIHEGTHGIQALDLVGRKVRQRGGADLTLLGSRIAETLRAATAVGLGANAASVAARWSALLEATESAWITDDPWDALANATVHLQAFGHVVVGWIWLDVALAARRSGHAQAEGKLAAMQYFLTYELPKVDAWLEVVARREPLCRDLDESVL